MAPPLRLFQIGQRGVDVVNKPQDLDDSELVTGQNVEIVTSAGGGALDQRAGMTRLNAVPLNSGAAVLMAHDVISPFLSDYTATLYVPFVTAGASKWRKSTDGITWTSVNVPATYIHNPPSTVAPGFWKAQPRIATIGRRMYFAGAVTTYGVDPIPIWQFDGTTAQIVSYIPPAVVGAALSTPATPTVGYNGSVQSSTWAYKVAARFGAAHSIASAAGNGGSNGANDITVVGNSCVVTPSSPPVAGASSYDVYRTGVGTTPNSTGLVGTIPIVNGAFTTGNGSPGGGSYTFFDNGLTGDASTPPATATGSTLNNAIVVLDVVTDGTSLYLAVMDVATSSGRILQFNPTSAIWTQIGAAFPIASGNGIAGSLGFYTGALTYATYTGTASGSTSYVASAGTPLPFGGIPNIFTSAASVAPTSLLSFRGSLYIAWAWIGAAGTAAPISKVIAITGPSSVRSGPATASKNAYTSLGSFNGLIFAGWTSGDGGTAARIESSPDGTTWTLEYTADAAEVPGQMVVLNNVLYVVMAKTTEAYNTKSRIVKRTADGTWSVADDPSDDYAGAIGVVYA